MKSCNGINFKRTKDCNKIDYIKHNANGTSMIIKPAKFGNIDITEFRSGQEGGDFDTISLDLRDENKFKTIFAPGEFLEIIPQYEYKEEFHEMCRFYVGYDKDSDLIESRVERVDELCKSEDLVFGVRGGSWCFQF
ncbi:MAG: hypothetical protein K0R18_410 [Bacillales bacterium]|jgi:hypothetical protein|nr:hypothetical protein [Bacillales bacterium]